jgi:hypothetical protein
MDVESDYSMSDVENSVENYYDDSDVELIQVNPPKKKAKGNAGGKNKFTTSDATTKVTKPKPAVKTGNKARKALLPKSTNEENIPAAFASGNSKVASPKIKPSAKSKTVEEVYQKKTQLEHILLRPDTYSTLSACHGRIVQQLACIPT